MRGKPGFAYTCCTSLSAPHKHPESKKSLGVSPGVSCLCTPAPVSPLFPATNKEKAEPCLYSHPKLIQTLV